MIQLLFQECNKKTSLHKRSCTYVSLDLEKAFNSVPMKVKGWMMKKKRIPGYCLEL